MVTLSQHFRNMKKFLIIFCLAALSAVAQIVPPSYPYPVPYPTTGTTPAVAPLTSFLDRTSYANGPLIYPRSILGSQQSVSDITERDSIRPSRRMEYMTVFVKDIGEGDTAGYYTLRGGIGNGNWVLLGKITDAGFQPTVGSEDTNTNIANSDLTATSGHAINGNGYGFLFYNYSGLDLSATGHIAIVSSGTATLQGGPLTLSASQSGHSDWLRVQTPHVIGSTAVNGQVLTLVNAANGGAEWVNMTGGGTNIFVGENFATTDLTFTTSRHHDPAGYNLTIGDGASGATGSGGNLILNGVASVVNGFRNVSIGSANTVSGNYNATLGFGNTVDGNYNFIIGGANTVNTHGSAYLIGKHHTANGNDVYAVGDGHIISGMYAGAFAGVNNTVNGSSSVILGGGWDSSSTVSGNSSSILTSDGSIVYGNYSSLIGGTANRIDSVGTRSGILGGQNNVINSRSSGIVGGEGNTVASDHGTPVYSAIIGGANNLNQSDSAVIVGGAFNFLADDFSSYHAQYSVIAGGYANMVYSPTSAVIGGRNNTVTNGESTAIIGGQGNMAAGDWSVVVGGFNNKAIAGLSQASGNAAKTSNWGERAHAGFGLQYGDGTSQQSLIHMGYSGSNASVLYTDGDTFYTTFLTMPDNTIWQVDVTLVAVNIANAVFGSYHRQITYSKIAGTVTMIGSPQVIGVDVGSESGLPPAAWTVLYTSDSTGPVIAVDPDAPEYDVSWHAVLTINQVSQ